MGYLIHFMIDDLFTLFLLSQRVLYTLPLLRKECWDSLSREFEKVPYNNPSVTSLTLVQDLRDFACPK